MVREGVLCRLATTKHLVISVRHLHPRPDVLRYEVFCARNTPTTTRAIENNFLRHP
jgi:hypothetical protein